MNTVKLKSIAAGKRYLMLWNGFRNSPLGIVGLIILLCFILIAVFCIQINPHDYTKVSAQFMDYPSKLHPLGTDQLGRDILSRVLFGTRISMKVGLFASLIVVFIGSLLGLISGYYGGIVDDLIMRFTDMFLVLPFLPLMIILVAILGQNHNLLIIIIGITSWPTMARIIRSEVLSIRQRAYVERARAIGAGNAHIIYRHILPNVSPLISANVVLTIPLAIISESALAFIGLGDPTLVSWGSILNDAMHNNAILLGHWWFYLPPGLAIVLLCLSFSFIGHTLDEIVNPRLRKEY